MVKSGPNPRGENMANGRDERGGPGDTPVPWTVVSVVTALFLTYLFWGPLASLVVMESGFLKWYYRPDFVAAAEEDWGRRDRVRIGMVAGPGAAWSGERVLREDERIRVGLMAGPGASQLDHIESILRQRARTRISLWVAFLAFPFQIVTIPLLLGLAHNTRPDQLGLTLRNGWRNLGAGLLSWAVLTPVVMVANYGIARLYSSLTSVGIKEHPLTELGTQNLSSFELLLFVLTAVVEAPVLEELIFRGMLQRWFISRPGREHLGMAGALAMAVATKWSDLSRAWGKGEVTFFLELAPALFVLALVPVYWFVWWRSRTPAGPAIFSTSLLFAAVHSFAWPTPIALFVLGLGLGILAHRTRSLVGPIVVHALFNSVTCLILFFG
jgi:membrane protease YdiL (CAAX protease family)